MGVNGSKWELMVVNGKNPTERILFLWGFMRACILWGFMRACINDG